MFVLDPTASITLIDVTPDLSDPHQYKFNGMEWQDEFDVNMYDFGARNYDPALGRWMNMDPLAEKYSNLSPYHISANNPIVFMDYNGEDYIVTINFEEKTATVSGTLYAAGEDMAAAQTGADFWNDQSGDFEYNFKDADGNSHSLTVNFDINVQEVDVTTEIDKENSVKIAANQDQTGGGNAFLVISDNELNDNTNGTTSANLIKVKESMVNSDTSAHEIGHALGMPHSNKGIMTPAQTDQNRSSTTNKNNIKNSVRNGIRERHFKDGRGNPTLNFEGNINPLNTPKDYNRFKKGKIN